MNLRILFLPILMFSMVSGSAQAGWGSFFTSKPLCAVYAAVTSAAVTAAAMYRYTVKPVQQENAQLRNNVDRQPVVSKEPVVVNQQANRFGWLQRWFGVPRFGSAHKIFAGNDHFPKVKISSEEGQAVLHVSHAEQQQQREDRLVAEFQVRELREKQELIAQLQEQAIKLRQKKLLYKNATNSLTRERGDVQTAHQARYEAQASELSNNQHLIMQLRNRHVELQQFVDSKQKLVVEYEQQIAQLKFEQERHSKNVSALHDKLSEQTALIEHMEQELQQAREAQDAAHQEQQAQYEDRINTLQHQLIQLRAEKQKCQNEVTLLENNVRALELEIANQNSALAAEKSEHKQRKEDWKTYVEQLRKKIQELEQQVDKQDCHAKELRREKEDLQKSLSTLTNQLHQLQCASFGKDIALEEELNDLQEAYDKLKSYMISEGYTFDQK